MLSKHWEKRPKVPKVHYTPKRNKVCDHCGKSVRHAGLKDHIRVAHTESTKKVKCDICSELVADKDIQIHLKRHEKRKKYICPICGLGLLSGHTLKVHIKAHTKEIKYTCDMCPKIFYEKYNLKHHKQVVHLKQKRFKCNICYQSFGNADL